MDHNDEAFIKSLREQYKTLSPKKLDNLIGVYIQRATKTNESRGDIQKSIHNKVAPLLIRIQKNPPQPQPKSKTHKSKSKSKSKTKIVGGRRNRKRATARRRHRR